MKTSWPQLFSEKRHFFVYCLIGVTGATLDFLCYYALVNGMSVPYLLANVISTTVGITNNFCLNALLNFKVRDRLWLRFVSFFGVGLLGLALSALLLYLLVARLGFNVNYSKLATIFVAVAVQYHLNRVVAFRK